MDISFRFLSGDAITPALERIAELRILVFREYPYLYAGSLSYERKYLASYASCPQARVILAFHGDDCVGVSTVMPLVHCEEEIRRPFVEHGFELANVDYFGESVVKREFRGKGLGVRFFEEREAHAREFGLTLCAFCAVERAPNDQRKPSNYRPNDAFWSKRGYARRDGMWSKFSWPDLGETVPSEKKMNFYLKELGS